MARNREKLNAWNRAYYAKRKNEPGYKARRRESAQRYYRKNRTKVDATRKRYHQENIEAYRQYRRDYRAFNPRGIYSALKWGAKKRGKAIAFSIDEFVRWWEAQIPVCFYCHRNMEQIRSQTDSMNDRARRFTIDRANNAETYTLPNIRLACYRCNSIKGDYFTEEEMLTIGQMVHAKELARQVSE